MTCEAFCAEEQVGRRRVRSWQLMLFLWQSLMPSIEGKHRYTPEQSPAKSVWYSSWLDAGLSILFALLAIASLMPVDASVLLFRGPG